MSRPLAGVRVLDLSRALSGPLSGRILSDLGADVVKIERDGSDISRAFGKVAGGSSGLYAQLNCGKRSSDLDLDVPSDMAVLADLVRECDVLIENFRPGVADRLGLGWQQLSAINPRLIMLSISGFGQSGPDAGRQAYAPIIHAESGLVSRQASLSGQPPVDIAFALADSLAGLHGTIAILAALRLRDQTGTGQQIDMSMLDALLATDDYTHYNLDEHPVRRASGETWPASGGPILISSDRRHIWRQLGAHFGLADPDPDASAAAKIGERSRLIAAWIAGHQSRDALKQDLEAADIAWAEIRQTGDALRSQEAAGRDLVVAVPDADGGVRRVIRMPYHFSNAVSGPGRGVPGVGADDPAEILREWASTSEPGRRSASVSAEASDAAQLS
jgi:CoA:oxalate CoA-transferase